MTESEVAKFLASSDSPPPPSAASAAEIHISAASPEQEECVVCCDTYPCAGGSWVGGMFQPCQKRPTTNAVRHSRGLVCILHHEFVKCQQCRLHVHVGCFVPKGTFYTPIHRDFLWTCQKCTLKPQSNDVKNEECTLTSESKVSPTFECTLPSEGNKLKTTSKCMFQNRQLLLQHISDHGWIIRGSTPRRIYFCCKKCALTFRAKAQDADIETGEWCAINMPSDHECCNLGFKRVATSVTTRVCNLPIDVFNEIQRLACCKAFCSLSIQTFIKQCYDVIVDTTLIFNIGYRARSKLGISEMEKLYAQQQVPVYTSCSFCTSTKIPGPKSAWRHVRTCISSGCQQPSSCPASEVTLCFFQCTVQCTLTRIFTGTSSGFRTTCTC